jgi:hypothetical protein
MFALFSKKATLSVWKTLYCESNFDRCERLKMFHAKQTPPPEPPAERSDAEHVAGWRALLVPVSRMPRPGGRGTVHHPPWALERCTGGKPKPPGRVALQSRHRSRVAVTTAGDATSGELKACAAGDYVEPWT